MAFIEREYQRVAADHPEASPAEALARVFTDEGYAAGVRQLPLVNGNPVGEQLCQQHCPVSHVAHEFPQLCEAETEAIGRVLGTHVQRLATIAHGDGVCTTCIPHVSASPTAVSQDIDEKETTVTSIEELNPGLKGIGRYEFGWSDRDEAGCRREARSQRGRRPRHLLARSASRSGCSTCA